jgi:OHCU decarboxylase
MSNAQYQIYKNLDELNKLSVNEAEAVFRDCCGSAEWARQMAAARPFAMIEDLYVIAHKRWMSLSPADWLEAFAAHPKIGSKKPAAAQGAASAEWSKGEQAGVNNAETRVLEQLAEANRLYLDKFGFIFIVCATGKTAEEMLAIWNARLVYSLEPELDLDDIEQSKINALRLDKLFER